MEPKQTKLSVDGDFIKKIRTEMGLSREKLADKSGGDGVRSISKPTIERMEQEKGRKFNIETIRTVARTLQTTTEALTKTHEKMAPVMVSRILEGKELYDALCESESIVINTPVEPPNKTTQTAAIELFKLANEIVARVRPVEGNLETMEAEYAFRGHINDLNSEGMYVYTGIYYRLLGYDIDYEEIRRNPDGAVSWKRPFDYAKDSNNERADNFDGFGFARTLVLHIDTEEKENVAIRMDTNPSDIPIHNWHNEHLKLNAQRATQGEGPLRHDELVELGLLEPSPKTQDSAGDVGQ